MCGLDTSSITRMFPMLFKNVFKKCEEMDSKGRILNMAFAVSAAFVFGSHLALTMAFNPDYTFPMIIGKNIISKFFQLYSNMKNTSKFMDTYRQKFILRGKFVKREIDGKNRERQLCESKGIRMHGHVLVWGNRKWQQPYWHSELFTKEELANYKRLFPNKPDHWASKDKTSAEWDAMSYEEVAQAFPDYPKRVDALFEQRIKQIAERYKGRLHSYDVVNESAMDDYADLIPENCPVSKSRYGLMTGDYPYKALKWAEKHFPKDVQLNINDYHRKPAYTAQVNRLRERGCKIDVMGIQMHLFNVKHCQDIATVGRRQKHVFLQDIAAFAATACNRCDVCAFRIGLTCVVHSIF